MLLEQKYLPLLDDQFFWPAFFNDPQQQISFDHVEKLLK